MGTELPDAGRAAVGTELPGAGRAAAGERDGPRRMSAKAETRTAAAIRTAVKASA
ncbi:MAG: hypothetical protein LBK08_12120 [Treponema sp.]|nr:hypothetical protein [Treponema sp.]